MFDWFVKESHFKNSPFVETGWGNGYVKIPFTHWLSNQSEEFINNSVRVHFGITYYKKVFGFLIVGFDTGHCYDNIKNWSKKRVEEETKSLSRQLFNLKEPEPEEIKINSFENCEVCGKVEGECPC